MKKKLCVCLIERSLQDCIDFVLTSDADIIEHRIDFMEEIRDINQIYSVSNTPIIATCRSHETGGRFLGEESERIKYLLEAIEGGVSYVDIEIESSKQVLKSVRQAATATGCKVIGSKHYLGSTPDTSELCKMIERIADANVDIIKIVTTPETIDDCKRTLNLYTLNETEIPMIAFGMGSIGKFTRVSSLFLGSPFMYVSQSEGREAASGQISLSNMRKLVRVLS